MRNFSGNARMRVTAVAMGKLVAVVEIKNLDVSES
jgi:hypothetical protein